MIDLITVGHVSIDSVRTSESTKWESVGGGALYFSLAAAIGGIKVGLVTRVASDFPLPFLTKLKGKVDTKGIVICDGKSTKFHISYSNDFRTANYELCQTNVGNEIKVDDVPQNYLLSSRMIHICPMHPLQQIAFREKARQYNLLASIHTSEFRAQNERESVLEAIKNTEIFFCNSNEAFLISQTRDEIAASEFLLNQGIKTVVITKGRKGVLLRSMSSMETIPSLEVEVVDPTGAGDVFAGGVVSYFLKSGDLRKACLYGRRLATEKIKGVGPSRLLKMLKNGNVLSDGLVD